jgi:short-subunit dehydrogenase
MSKPTLLILGATSDVGRALAHEYASHGFNIILSGRHLEEMEKSAKDIQIRHDGIEYEAVYFDALDTSSHAAFYRSLESKPTGVVSVIGLLGEQERGFDDFTHAEQIITTNYTALVSILNIIAQDFKDKKSGFIIGVSSVAGERGRQSNFLYGSAKAGFTAYLSGLRNAMFKEGVHVMTVNPGFINTSMTEGMDLPGALTLQPEDVAKDIYKAQQKSRDVSYTGWYWRWIMMIIRNIPETIFKRLGL